MEIITTFLYLISLAPAAAQTRVSHLIANEEGTHHKLDNPVSVQYLKSKLSKHSPRLLLTAAKKSFCKSLNPIRSCKTIIDIVWGFEFPPGSSAMYRRS